MWNLDGSILTDENHTEMEQSNAVLVCQFTYCASVCIMTYPFVFPLALPFCRNRRHRNGVIVQPRSCQIHALGGKKLSIVAA